MAGDLLDRWTGIRLRRSTSPRPRPHTLVGGLLTFAVVAELTLTMTVTSTMPVNVNVNSMPTQSMQIESTTVGWQTLILAYVLGLVSTVPLMFMPEVVAAATASVAGALSLAFFHTVTIAAGCALVITLYRFGRTGSRLLAPALAAPFPLFALGFLLAGVDSARSEATAVVVLLASLAPAAAWAGLAHGARVQALAHAAEQETIASTLLEHTARGERARIARELHDVVAHHISMIAVQAETARVATPDMPDTGARRLLEIGDTARAALTEMRRLLGVLRDDARAAVPTRPDAEPPTADRRPQPGLQQLNELLDDARNASMTGIRLIVSGPPMRLDPGVELAAYRIIQEALTNARRHAPGAAVDVELHYSVETLRLRIRDNGPGPPTAVSAASVVGHGMLGMRERTMAVGGRLYTGAAAVGGFVVEATLPARAETMA